MLMIKLRCHFNVCMQMQETVASGKLLPDSMVLEVGPRNHPRAWYAWLGCLPKVSAGLQHCCTARARGSLLRIMSQALKVLGEASDLPSKISKAC